MIFGLSDLLDEDSRGRLLLLHLHHRNVQVLLQTFHLALDLLHDGQASFQAVAIEGYAGLLLREHIDVEADQLEEGLGSGVVEPALHLEEVLVGGIDGKMHLGHVSRNGAQHVIVADIASGLQVDQEASGDSVQGVAGPRHELVDDRTADQSGKFAAADAEVVPDRRVAEGEVQVLAHLVDEERKEAIAVIGVPPGLGRIAHPREDAVVLLAAEEVRDVPAGEHVVDVNEEALVRDLAVGHQEAVREAWLHGGLFVELLEIHLQVCQPVALVHEDAEYVLVIDETAQARQRLLARAADTDEQRVAAGVVGDARDSADVPKGVVEEHEVHGRVRFVVLVELVFHHLLQVRPVLHWQVLPLVAARLRDERCHNQRLGEEVIFGHAGECLPRRLFEYDLKLRLVLPAYKAVREDPVALMQPHTGELGRTVLVELRVGIRQPLENIGDVLQVELVVELGGRRQKALSVQDGCQSLDRSSHDWFTELLYGWHEAPQVLGKDCSVDAGDELASRRECRRHSEAALQARVDHERPSLGVHARSEKNVCQQQFL
mmetsp:Transcript_33532/g.94240  ORF Transcript_33532/g.94240 Transcript_33532/m.94240 type:complete len:546 (-) Transcript_33532:220-1857(-)